MKTLRLCAAAVALFCLAGPVFPADDSTTQKTGDKPAADKPAEMDRAKLEADFTKQMTNATLVGSFTVVGKDDGKTPKDERYELGTVKKIDGDQWLWVAKIKYGDKNYSIPVPIRLTMKWAGDTPVITMTDFKIPAMGTFTARVLFYGDRYVGTWQHGKVGGHMYGTIEPAKPDKPAPDAKPDDAPGQP
jgi:hypothetical protein